MHMVGQDTLLEPRSSFVGQLLAQILMVPIQGARISWYQPWCVLLLFVPL